MTMTMTMQYKVKRFDDGSSTIYVEVPGRDKDSVIVTSGPGNTPIVNSVLRIRALEVPSLEYNSGPSELCFKYCNAFEEVSSASLENGLLTIRIEPLKNKENKDEQIIPIA